MVGVGLGAVVDVFCFENRAEVLSGRGFACFRALHSVRKFLEITFHVGDVRDAGALLLALDCRQLSVVRRHSSPITASSASLAPSDPL